MMNECVVHFMIVEFEKEKEKKENHVMLCCKKGKSCDVGWDIILKEKKGNHVVSGYVGDGINPSNTME